MELKILRKDFSENVVNAVLYWLSEDAAWTIENNEQEFIIHIKPHKDKTELSIKEKLHRLLNDFHLREKLNSSSKHLREKIIEQALTKVYLHNV